MGLFDRGAGKDVKGVRVGGLNAGEDFVISGGANHSGIVAGELRVGEEEIEVVGIDIVGSFGVSVV